MKTLILFRHAKSAWDQPGIDDFDRPLNARGQRDAPAMAAWLAGAKVIPDLVVCSSARRTRETLAALAPLLPETTRVSVRKAVYLASADRLISMTCKTPDTVNNLLILAHNPGLEDAAHDLVGSGEKDARKALEAKLPTAAIAVINFDVAKWGDITAGDGYLAHFMTPKLLAVS
jgi:phosphohistidine phosphatase